MGAESRETTIRVCGVERVIRTQFGGRVRTAKQLETAHTRAVKEALTEERRKSLKARADELRAYADELEANPPELELWPDDAERAAEHAKLNADDARRRADGIESTKIAFPSHPCNWEAARSPLRPVATQDPTKYLVEVAPGHYATEDAAEGLDIAA
ncbi:hypothetical protein AB0P37_08410 [Streptomyces antimycoticus]|uniref:hypothetical protein n=1 Tax=Streptomyces antimycoticus TaxID=68175 RepID=UPI00341E8D46